MKALYALVIRAVGWGGRPNQGFMNCKVLRSRGTYRRHLGGQINDTGTEKEGVGQTILFPFGLLIRYVCWKFRPRNSGPSADGNVWSPVPEAHTGMSV